MVKTLPKTREGFDRPNHPDWKDSSELKKDKFSGTRHNRITHEFEIWTLGDLRAHVPVRDREACKKAYEDVFGLNKVDFS